MAETTTSNEEDSNSFFYHSFPRQQLNESEKDREQRGLKILELIIRHGLLLTLEDVSWQEPSAATLLPPVGTVQRRICFTNLRPSELKDHKKIFGPLSVEFVATAFVQIGGVPVMYFPRLKDRQKGAEGIGASMIARLADIHGLLATLSKLEQQVLKGRQFEMFGTSAAGKRFGQATFSEDENATISRFLACIHAYASIPPFEDLRGAMTAIAALFYYLDDSKYTGPLGYYKQREWRILGLAGGGRRLTQVATEEQQRELVRLNEAFFLKKMRFVAGEDEMVRHCHFYKELNGRHILTYAKRLLVPTGMVDQVKALLAGANIELDVSATE